MEYLLRAAKQYIENMVKEAYDAMLTDIDCTETDYSDHYASMGTLLFKLHSYTKMSDLMKDVESGWWSVALLDHQDDEGMIQFFDTITKGAQHYLDGVVKQGTV